VQAMSRNSRLKGFKPSSIDKTSLSYQHRRINTAPCFYRIAQPFEHQSSKSRSKQRYGDILGENTRKTWWQGKNKNGRTIARAIPLVKLLPE
jgi:hypothetical protein